LRTGDVVPGARNKRGRMGKSKKKRGGGAHVNRKT